jgi:integrase/recombinase XerC
MLLIKLKERFLAYKREQQRSEQTLANYQSDLEGFIGKLPRKDISALNRETMEDYRAHLVNTGFKPNSVRRRLSALSEFCKFCCEREYIRTNPLIGMTRPKRPRRLPEILMAAEMEMLLALPLSPRERAVRAILCYAGCRRGAITRLDLRDVKLDLKLLIFRRGKGDQDVSVPMNPPLLEALREWLVIRGPGSPEDPVFAGAAASRIHPNIVYHMVKRWGRLIGRPRLHPHLLRHSPTRCNRSTTARTKPRRLSTRIRNFKGRMV